MMRSTLRKLLLLASVALAPLAAAADLVLASQSTATEHTAYELLGLGGNSYWATAHASGAPRVDLTRLGPRGEISGSRASIAVPAMLLAGSRQPASTFSALAALDGDGKWLLYRLEGQTPRVAAKADLSASFGFVAAVATLADLAIVAGSDSDERPLVCVFDSQLKKVGQAVLTEPSHGVVSGVAVLGDALVLAANPAKGPGQARLWKMSSALRALKNVELPGGAAAVTSHQQGVLVSYSSGQDVFVQSFDVQLKGRWKTRALVREGETTAFFVPVSLSRGAALIGANRGRLAVVRLSPQGELLRTSEDAVSGLMPPAGGYRVVVEADRLHVLGMARRRADPVTAQEVLFRFLDTP